MKKWQLLCNIILEIFVFLVGVAALVIFLPKLLGFFWPFVAAWILAMMASPLCNFLESYIKLNKKWSSAIIIILVLVGIAGLMSLIISKLGRELISLLSDAPLYYYYFQHALKLLGTTVNGIIAPISPEVGGQIQSAFNDILSQAGSAINNFAPKGVEMLGSAAGSITNGLIGTVVMILSAYFFIADRDQVTRGIGRLFPEDICETINDIKNKLLGAIGGFFVAQFKIMGIVFCILLAGFLILRNPYALLLALVICVVDLLPILGTGTIMIPWALIAFIRGDMKQGAILILLYVICLLARQLLQPKIIGDSLGLDTLPTLVLIYTGYKVYGMKGMILALFFGVIFVSIYKLGLFDNKVKRIQKLFYEYRHFDEEN